MKRSTARILTTHTGSLPRPADILEAMRARGAGQAVDEREFEERVRAAVAENVEDQISAGIDIVNDGECGKPSFNTYVLERLSGFEVRVPSGDARRFSGPVDLQGRDAAMFPDYYATVLEHNPFDGAIRAAPRVCVGPIRYAGRSLVERDIANLRDALATREAAEAFLPASSPVPRLPNEFYDSDDEYAVAYADAMREEYEAILDAGLILQVDDPQMLSAWDGRRDLALEDYRRLAGRRVEVLNYALRGLPEDRIRYHTCYGINFGPRMSDLELADIADILLTIRVGAYSFEAANPRHEHEWQLFADPDRPLLAEGKLLIPGVVTQSNVMVEHPEVVAARILRWTAAIGPERVIAGTDCGFASYAGNSEIPPTVAWAKLRALGDGARLASQRLTAHT
jgi:5-methyltetrahydropteroyltriglutamate--homocysteine methyltransferase